MIVDQVNTLAVALYDQLQQQGGGGKTTRELRGQYVFKKTALLCHMAPPPPSPSALLFLPLTSHCWNNGVSSKPPPQTPVEDSLFAHLCLPLSPV